MVLARVLDAHHVPDILDDTDGPVVTGPVRTYGAEFFVRNHEAFPAIPGLLPEPYKGRGKMTDILLGLPQKVQGKTQGAALAYSRKRADGTHGIFKKPGRIFLRYRHALWVFAWYAVTAALTWP